MTANLLLPIPYYLFPKQSYYLFPDSGVPQPIEYCFDLFLCEVLLALVVAKSGELHGEAWLVGDPCHQTVDGTVWCEVWQILHRHLRFRHCSYCFHDDELKIER